MTDPAGALDPIRGAFRAVTVACVPAAQDLGPDGWSRAEAVVDEALAERPASVRRQVVLFARVLGFLARVRYGRALDRLGARRTRALLGMLEGAPILLLRRGTWGLRTLAFMGYYGQEEVRRDLGYRAAAAGWEARADSRRPWPTREGAAPPEAGVLTADDCGGAGPGPDEVPRD